MPRLHERKPKRDLGRALLRVCHGTMRDGACPTEHLRVNKNNSCGGCTGL